MKIMENGKKNAHKDVRICNQATWSHRNTTLVNCHCQFEYLPTKADQKGGCLAVIGYIYH